MDALLINFRSFSEFTVYLSYLDQNVSSWWICEQHNQKASKLSANECSTILNMFY